MVPADVATGVEQGTKDVLVIVSVSVYVMVVDETGVEDVCLVVGLEVVVVPLFEDEITLVVVEGLHLPSSAVPNPQ